MKINHVAMSLGNGRLRQHTIVQKIAYLLLILVFIQLLNQFLIFSGAALERAIRPTMQNPRFVVGIYQQVVQALTGILLFHWLFQKGIQQLGINTWDKKRSLTFFLRFVLLWLAIVALYVTATYFFFPNEWQAMRAIALPPTNTIVTTLLFQSFFPGMGEEILFRGFIINVLAAFVFTNWQQNNASKWGIVALSSGYFAVAHIYFTLSPLQLTHIDPVQIAIALGCGAFYAVVFLKTKSLLASFLSHNFANVTSTLVGYLISGV